MESSLMAAKKPAAKKAPAKGKKPAVKARAPNQLPVAPKIPKRPNQPGAGRPTLYKPEYCQLATNYCLMGATDAELARYFEVNEDTVHEWKKVHPEFSESICLGREKADAHIANALYHRAKGYSHREDDIRTLSSGGGRSEIVITPTIKHYPPDTAAASLWLRNRQGARWRDKTDVELSGRLTLDKLPQEELEARLAELQQRLGASA